MILSVQLLSCLTAIHLKLAASSLLGKVMVEINISPSRNVTMDEGLKESPCITLDQYGLTHYIDSSRIVSVCAGQHELQATINVSNISNLVIAGSSENTTTINCSNSAAFSFHSCSNISLQHLTIIGCGVETEMAAVFFQDGNTVTLEDVTISDSIGAGFVAVNVQGLTSLLTCTLRDTTPVLTTPELHGWAGNGIIYNGKNYSSYQFFANNSYFSNLKIENSSAGFTVNVSNCYANINITNSEFTDNCHHSSPGGNLRIILQNLTKPRKQHVYLENVTITRGKALKGGGMYIDITLTPDADSKETSINSWNILGVFKRVQFHNNTATVLGGGLYIQQLESQNVSTCQNIQFINCIFTHNSLELNKNGGVAIHSNNYILRGFLAQATPQYQTVLQNCVFTKNGDSSTSKNSVVTINAHKDFRIDSIRVENNSYNAITAINSNLVFNGSTILSSNGGSSGGGLLLCENSILYFKPNTRLEITNNSVQHSGGGICIQPQCLEAHPRCFYQFYNKISLPINASNITIIVKNNNATFAGDNIFGGDVDYCYLLDSSKPEKELNRHDNFSVEVFNSLFKCDTVNSSVTSQPRRAYICNDLKKWKSFNHISIYPGQSFNISAVLVGQLNGTVPGVVMVKVSPKNANISLLTPTFPTPKNQCSNAEFTISTSITPITVNLTLIADHSGDNSGFENLDIDTECSLSLHIKQCPVGSILSPAQRCESVIPQITFNMNGEGDCPVMNFDNNNVWIQYNNDSDELYYNSFCPTEFCSKSKNISLSRLRNKNPRCQNNRANIFCGECATNYSALLGTNGCGKCGNNLILLMPITLAGIALVIFLILSNLTVSEGTLSGLIFYVNIIQANSSSLIPSSRKMKILKIFIGWLNLDLAISACLYDGMTAYDEAWLEFAFPIYIWILTFLIILLSNKYQWIAKLASKNGTKVLATLVLVSYTRFLQAIIFNFSYITYYKIREGAEQTTSSEILWLIDPNIQYWSLQHTLLFTCSVLFAIVCLPFTLVLLFVKPLHHFSHLRLLKWIATLKPFLDAFTGPYTDNGRFWPGMLLVARITIFITAGMNSFNDPTIRLGITMSVVIFILIIAASVRPGLYTNGKLDYLEYFFLLNLSGLCLGKGYLYHLNDTDNNIYVYENIFLVFVSLSLFAFVGIILYHIGLQLRRVRISLTIKNWIMQKLAIFGRLVQQDNHNQPLDNYPPHIEFIHQREPIIADHEE